MAKANFTVVCIEAVSDMFTKNKLYDIVDGTLINDNGYMYNHIYDMYDINGSLGSSFKLVEDTTNTYRVKCTYASVRGNFILNKIYSVVNGVISDEKCCSSYGQNNSIDEMNSKLVSQFRKVDVYYVRCIENHTTEKFFTKGKLYQVIDGEITDDTGRTYISMDNIDILNEELISQFELAGVKEEVEVEEILVEDKEMKKEFTVNDLKVGMLIEFGNGSLYMVLETEDGKKLLSNKYGDYVNYLEYVTDDLQSFNADPRLAIIRVYGLPKVEEVMVAFKMFSTTCRKVVWGEKEKVILTLEEIRSKFNIDKDIEIEIKKD